nr:MAG TPA: hypothetical protein [Caudoviricetes sp.]
MRPALPTVRSKSLHGSSQCSLNGFLQIRFNHRLHIAQSRPQERPFRQADITGMRAHLNVSRRFQRASKRLANLTQRGFHIDRPCKAIFMCLAVADVCVYLADYRTARTGYLLVYRPTQITRPYIQHLPRQAVLHNLTLQTQRRPTDRLHNGRLNLVAVGTQHRRQNIAADKLHPKHYTPFRLYSLSIANADGGIPPESLNEENEMVSPASVFDCTPLFSISFIRCVAIIKMAS